MRFGSNQWGDTIEIFGKSVHIGNKSLQIAHDLLTMLRQIKSKGWSLEIADLNCESHYIPLRFKEGILPDTIDVKYEESYLGELSRDELMQVCKDRIVAEYEGMWISNP